MPRVVLFCLLLALSGCAQRSTVMVDSVVNATVAAHQDRCYAVASGMPGVRSDDARFMVYKEQLESVLASLDYCLARDESEATALVLLSYGEESWGAYQEEPRVGVGMGMGSGTGRGGSFFGLGVGVSQPYGGASPSVTRRIDLDAVPVGAPDKPGSLWSVSLTATGRGGNLRAAFPKMLDAARPYLGRDSHGPVTVTLDGDIW